MTDLETLKKSAVALLTRSTARPAAPARAAALPSNVAAFTAAPAPPPALRRFSLFMPRDAQRAADLVQLFDALAEAHPGVDGLERVLDLAHAAETRWGLPLVKYALCVFIVNNPAGRKLPLPRLFEREPELLRRLDRLGPLAKLTLTAPVGEAALAWYREDPFLNEHHEHWHVVYPFSGVSGKLKDREGELFTYMHQQMLARYDTERLAASLAPVVPLDDYRAPIGPGYDSSLPGRVARPAGTSLHDTPTIAVETLESWRDRLRTAVATSTFSQADGGAKPVTLDDLGSTVEASIGSVTSASQYYGNLHNMGHVAIAFSANAPGVTDPSGVMMDPAVAVMDPVFFQWHRQIDDLFYAVQQQLPPYDFSDAPQVTLRHQLAGGAAGQSPDVILALASQIPGAVAASADTITAWAQTTFGGASWDEDFRHATATSTDTLTTYLATETVQPGDDGAGSTVSVTYLDQDEFVYFLRVENPLAAAQTVTVRIWIACQASQAPAPDRRLWIEMDTFQATLAASAKQVIYRPAKVSSVIKKKNGAGVKPPALLTKPGEDDPDATNADYCDCGWPYNLLLPKGTAAGMPFRLMVMISTDDIDLQGTTSTCGGVSLCGARTLKFPDRRPMGYPFSRPFAAGHTIESTIAAQANMAARDFTIRFRGALAPP